MSETYVPNGTVPAPTVGANTRYTIQSSTNASPIQVTFTAGTAINDQDTIEIEGHLVNTAANGVWVARKVSGSVYNLVGSTGNGVGGQTGYAIDYQVTPAITIPDDGELITASSVNPAFESNANALPFLYRRAGAARLVDVYDVDWSEDGSGWGTFASSSTSFAAMNVGSASSPGLFLFASGTDPAPPAIQAGDFFECFLSLQGLCDTAGQFNRVCLGFSQNGGGFSPIGGPFALFANTIIGGTLAFRKTGLGATSWFDFAVMVSSSTGSTAQFQGIGAGHLLVNHYRPN